MFQHPAGIAQLVEHNLAKVGVASSSLVSRSKFDEASAFAGVFLCLKRVRMSFQGAMGYNSVVHQRLDGRVVMQRPAKPCTPVRFRV